MRKSIHKSRLQLESLEDRMLPAVYSGIDYAVIYSSDANDTVIVQDQGTDLSITENGVRHEVSTARATELGREFRIYFYGNEGDDYFSNESSIPAYARGDGYFPHDGNDTLISMHADDILLGNGGNDALYSFSGNVVLDGGAGNDYLMNEGGVAEMIGNDGNDTLLGGPGADTLQGGDGDDHLEGKGGRDIYRFDADSPLGSDEIVSTNDTDVLDFSATTAAVNVRAGERWYLGWDYDENMVYRPFHYQKPHTVNSNLSLIFHGQSSWELIGGAGNDILSESDTNGTTIRGGLGDDRLFVSSYANHEVYGEEGDDRLSVGRGNAILAGGEGDDYLYVDHYANATLIGGAGNDELWGNDSQSVTYKFDADVPLGTDTIYSGARHHVLDFSDTSSDVHVDLSNVSSRRSEINDNLRLIGSRYVNNVIGGSGNDTIIGNDESNTLKGGPGHDFIEGLGGNDNIHGDAGFDTIVGGVGNDTMHGGLGVNTYQFDVDQGQAGTYKSVLYPSSAWNPVYNWGRDTVVSTSYLGDVLDFSRTSQEDIRVNIGLYDTFQTVTSKLQLNLSGKITKVIGGYGDDTLTGSSHDDELRGGFGNDTYWFDADSESGHDTIVDGVGKNTIDYSATSEDITVNLGRLYSLQTINSSHQLTLYGNITELIGGSGNGYLTGSSHANILSGRDGNDTMVGNNGDDTIHGGDGSDYIAGGNGHDEIYGDDGKDYLYGGNGNDYIKGGQGGGLIDGQGGDDRLYGSTIATSLLGGAGDDYIEGAAGNDTIKGGDGDDMLFGFGGDDELHGGFGDDIIKGMTGNDTLKGGDGADTLYGDAGDDVMMTGKDSAQDVAYDMRGINAVVFSKDDGDKVRKNSDSEAVPYETLDSHQSFTISIFSGLAVVTGGGFTTGLLFTKEAGEIVVYGFSSFYVMGGVAAGIYSGIEIGYWNVGREDFAGDSWGISASAGPDIIAPISAGATAWFSTGDIGYIGQTVFTAVSYGLPFEFFLVYAHTTIANKLL